MGRMRGAYVRAAGLPCVVAFTLCVAIEADDLADPIARMRNAQEEDLANSHRTPALAAGPCPSGLSKGDEKVLLESRLRLKSPGDGQVTASDTS